MSMEDMQGAEPSMDTGMSAEKAKNARAAFRRLLQYLMRQKWKLFFVIIATIGNCVFTMISPIIVGKAIDLIFNGIQNAVKNHTVFQINYHTMGNVIILLLIVYGISAFFSLIQQYIMSTVSQSLTLTLRKEASEKLSNLPLRYYDKTLRGEIMSRVTNDLEKVSDTLQYGLLQFISSVIGIIGAILIMFYISPLLTCVTLLTVIMGIVITVIVSHKSHHYFSENQRAIGEVNGLIEEFYTGRIEIKTFGKEEDAEKKVEEASKKLCSANKKAQFISFAVMPAIRLFNQIGYVLIAILGAMLIVSGRLTLGIVQAFFQYVNQVAEPITDASYTINTMQAAVASAERVFLLLDEEEEEKEVVQSAPLSTVKGEVCFEHIRFGYQENKPLMEDINIHVKSGQKIAIVGPTGAGKTTLINLLMRFYEIQQGKISIDGVNIVDMKRNELRSKMGMVLQDAWLFGGSIKDNISYGREDATEKEIIQAAKAAHVDHFIRTLPHGYETVLNEEGSNISQGQRQLLTIARVILANPAILILDEATSSVDTRTELAIQKAMDHLMKGRTSFVIAHRLSTILDADCILVMKEGTIIEQGNHSQLMEQKGFYAELYNSQFA